MRIITRGDFDGLTCSVLLTLAEDVDEILLVRQEEIQEDTVPITKNDIIANLPYHSNCGMWFDHHVNEVSFAHEIRFEGSFKVAPSCSRVIYDYYIGQIPELGRFEKLVAISDKIDSAQLSEGEIKNPHGWFIIERTLHAFDPSGRLGDFHTYFVNMVNWIQTYSLSSILLSDDVQNRIEHVRGEYSIFVDVLRDYSHSEKNVIITDSRELKHFPNGNRFLIYTLFPEQNVSISIYNKRGTDNSVIFCGHNIFNRTCKTHIGDLMEKYNGSGRQTAGTCMVPQDDADRIMREIIDTLIANG